MSPGAPQNVGKEPQAYCQTATIGTIGRSRAWNTLNVLSSDNTHSSLSWRKLLRFLCLPSQLGVSLTFQQRLIGATVDFGWCLQEISLALPYTYGKHNHWLTYSLDICRTYRVPGLRRRLALIAGASHPAWTSSIMVNLPFPARHATHWVPSLSWLENII